MRALLLVALAGLTAVPVAGQSLGELAAKEKERREKAKGTGTKSYSDEDLKDARGASGPSPAPSPSASPKPVAGRGIGPTGPVAKPNREPLSQDAIEEQRWRGEAEGLRNAITDAQRSIDEAQAKLELVRTGLSQPQPIDAMRQQPLNPLVKEGGQAAAEQALSDAKAALEKARQDQAAFEERARRANIPPGWLR
jgi:hypothetical protein